MEEMTVINIEGMSCEHCEKAVSQALQSLPGVTVLEVSHTRKCAVVRYDAEQASLDAMKRAIEEEGYDPTD